MDNLTAHRSFIGRRKVYMGLQVLGIFLWLSNLKYTDAYFSVYVLMAGLGLACLLKDEFLQAPVAGKVKWSALVLGIVFSALVLSANYPVFQRIRNPQEVSAGSNLLMNGLEAIAVFLGGIPIGYHCLVHLYLSTVQKSQPVLGRASGNHPVRFFLIVLGIIVLIDGIYLFAGCYPGCVSHDSMRQIDQTYTGVYNNVLPYWYTRFIGLLLSLGYGLFHEINAAVAFYSCIQILLMGSIFAYGMVTLYERKTSRFTLGAAFLFYAAMPYNIVFSISMWKDVLFSGCVLLLLVSAYRILKALGSRIGNYITLILGGIGVSLMRTNGWYVMLVSLLILLVCGREIRRKLAAAMAVVVAVGFFMNVPMIRILHVPGVDAVETLSLPLQQIGKVIVEQKEISPEDQAFLGEIMDLESVPETYQKWTSDPMKLQVWETSPEYLTQHMGQFFSLWLRLGLQYPKEYFEAWVELTKGYWNGGYDYYIYAEYVADNSYGIAMNFDSNPIKSLMKAYFAFTRESVLFEPFLSIGLNVWAAGALLWLSIVKKRREAVLFIPLFVILAGLWVGSPVFSEFRYAYPVTVSVPFLIPTVLSQEE